MVLTMTGGSGSSSSSSSSDVGSSDITMNSGTTLNVASSTFTTSAAQKLSIVQGVGADTDIGAHDLRAQTITADGLTSGRIVFAGTNGVLSDDSDLLTFLKE